jgi:uncharacterized integral membrane protein
MSRLLILSLFLVYAAGMVYMALYNFKWFMGWPAVIIGFIACALLAILIGIYESEEL